MDTSEHYALGLAHGIMKSAFAKDLMPQLRLAASRYLDAVDAMMATSKKISPRSIVYADLMTRGDSARRMAHEELISTYKRYLQEGGKRLYRTDPLDRHAVGDMASKIVKGKK